MLKLVLVFFSKLVYRGLNSSSEWQWFIRNHPLIFRKWNSDVDLLKEDVGNVLVWVKLHGVPITAFSEDGLSAIATKVGTPLMLDSYTSGMCLQSWGKSSYAREECSKNIGLGVVKNLKKPSQTSRGVLVGPKVSFKPHKEYRPVPKMQTANSSGNKKKGVVPTNEVISMLVMSSPNHPTSNIEDAFSSNFPDYISASPDHVSASPRKTYSSSSNNSFCVVPIVSPTLSLFHDDPYMKVMHAYYAKESPIPPPTIVLPSTMLSSMFNPQEFFLPEELLSPKKQGHNQSFSSTFALPQEFEMGESSRKTSLERHEEKIEEILNHLDELSLNRIEHIEDKIEGLGKGRIARLAFRIANLEQLIEEKSKSMPPKRMSTSVKQAMTQAAIRKLVVTCLHSLEDTQQCQPINFKGSEGAVGLICWFERTELVFSRSNCIEDCKVKFATGTLTEEALS
ncbi:reverse transcriptase domain-containing protein [Tanacetum coccineum]|uniref:Reverse transcriptase domain-containing protein n=1 Tax=Tanacetum coccineum TaxID=301880 RepID=A0ABQ5BSX7_9ASTR